MKLLAVVPSASMAVNLATMVPNKDKFPITDTVYVYLFICSNGKFLCAINLRHCPWPLAPTSEGL